MDKLSISIAQSKPRVDRRTFGLEGEEQQGRTAPVRDSAYREKGAASRFDITVEIVAPDPPVVQVRRSDRDLSGKRVQGV